MDSLQLSMQARISSLQMVHNASASHIGSALSIIDILSVLYSSYMYIDANNPEMVDRDRFILSKGHACVAVYSILAECGFFEKEKLLDYGKNGSILMNHISHKVPGVEFSTGSLGHGLPFGVGKALYAKINKYKWKTFVLLSDGEMQEGSNWEAFMFAAYHNLDNLIVIIDYNNLQSLKTVDETLSILPIDEKLESFGWNVLEVDGHDHNDLEKTLIKTSNTSKKPNLVIAKTIKGKGVSFMENKVEWHYKSPSSEELNIAISEILNA